MSVSEAVTASACLNFLCLRVLFGLCVTGTLDGWSMLSTSLKHVFTDTCDYHTYTSVELAVMQLTRAHGRAGVMERSVQSTCRALFAMRTKSALRKK